MKIFLFAPNFIFFLERTNIRNVQQKQWLIVREVNAILFAYFKKKKVWNTYLLKKKKRYQQIYRKSTTEIPLLKLRPVPKRLDFCVVSVVSKAVTVVHFFPRALWERVGKFRILEQVSKRKKSTTLWKTWKGNPEITTQEENIF